MTSSAEEPPFEKSDSEVVNFITSFVTPGYLHPWAFNILYFALGGLACVLLFLLVEGGFNIHYVIMLTMTVGLFFGIQWFMQELEAVKAEERRERRKQRSKKKKAGKEQ